MSVTLNLEAERILGVGFAEKDNPARLNLRSKLTVLSYVRIADEILQQLPPSPTIHILDWGTGAGQMSYLLTKRGYKVTSFDYLEDKNGFETEADSSVRNSTYQFSELELPLISSTEPVKLPFPDAHFEAVLSCGVLEHVSNEIGSLAEIRRVLKSGGLFFIYQLPQKGSWLEFVIGRLKLGYVHERKYSAKSIQTLLISQGFEVYRFRRANMLPKNFTGMPARLKQLFEKRPFMILKIDQALARVPVLNLLGGILELTARKR